MAPRGRPLSIQALLALAGVTLPAVACSDYQVAPREALSGLAAALTADPPLVDFGMVPRGEEAVAGLTLINPGDVELRLDEVQLAPPFSLVDGSIDRLGAGARATLELGYRAGGEREDGMLTVISGDQQLRVPLSGGALVPGLSITPPVLDLGSVFEGCEVDFELALSNPGAAPAEVEGWGLLGEDIWLAEELPRDLVLAPGETLEVHGVMGAPLHGRDGADLQAELVVRGAAPAVELRAPISGAVARRPMIEERFYQDGPWDLVDIVLVVDRSGSMSEERMQMAAGSRTLFEALHAQELDWRVGVVTQDSGCLNGIVDRDDMVDETTFLELMEGDWGRLTESGLSLARNATLESEAGGCNAGFFRPDARPAFLFLSDEGEQSDDSWEELVAQLQEWDPAVSLSAVVGPAPDGCATASPGHGYLEAASATGGSQLSICSTDWRPWLEDESARLTGAPTGVFALESRPAPVGEVLVWIDDEPVTDFSIDRDAATLVFPDHAWPGPGARIDVAYPVSVPCDD